jgi:hypothetical protein
MDLETLIVSNQAAIDRGPLRGTLRTYETTVSAYELGFNKTVLGIAACDCTCECCGNVGIPQDMRQVPNRREFPALSHRINVLTPISCPYES